MVRSNIVYSFGLCALALGCSTGGGATLDVGEGGDDNTPGGSVNVSQGGAQDIALFRSLVQAGQVPSPETLDPVGFFAEHAIDLPDATCGKDVCVHPFLAVAPRFNGSNWTMAFVGMNTAVDPSMLERPPLHLAVAIEDSQYAKISPDSFGAGLEGLVASLRPEDRVSIVTFGQTAQRRTLLASPEAPELINVIYDVAGGLANDTQSVGLYDGIAATATAFADGDAQGFDGDHRILLLTSGHATSGITDPDHILGLGEALVEQGNAFGVIGVGEEFDAKVPAALGSMGAGTYAYALGPGDLNNLLTEEGKTTLYPLATEFTLKIAPTAGYKVGRIYGTKRATATPDGASLSMPALFIGQRDGETDVGGSRRGGGGGLFVELLFDKNTASGIGADAPAFQVSADWKSAKDASPQNLDSVMLNSLPPGENPDEMWWTLSDDGDGKPYMMLNMYLAMRGSLDFYQAGDCQRALGLIDMMQTSVGAWLGKYTDTDITDDNNLMLMLRQNIETTCDAALSPTEPIEPTDFGGGCCFS
jgi:Ca-activated chloride channel family protein